MNDEIYQKGNEDMTATTRTRSQVIDNTRNAVDSVSRVTLIVLGVVSCLIGLWATTSFVGALFSYGPAKMFTGLVTALTGI